MALGTLLLAFFTAHLGVVTREEGEKARKESKKTREESRKERRRLRLKEQLDELYSPLMSIMPDIERVASYAPHSIISNLRGHIQQFRPKSEYLASEELRTHIRTIFRPDSETSSMEWGKFCIQFMNRIKMDWEALLKEYNELTA